MFSDFPLPFFDSVALSVVVIFDVEQFDNCLKDED